MNYAPFDHPSFDDPPYRPKKRKPKPVATESGKPATYAIGERVGTRRPEWLVHSIFRKNTNCVLFGESGSRKTWLAIDLALSVATGTDFVGHFKTKKSKVFYIISEGADDFELRALAWCEEKGIDPPTVDWFAYRPGAYDFNEDNAIGDCLAHIDERIKGAGLIIVDTLAKNFNGDSDKNSELGRFLNEMERLREATGATVVVIHHTGWNNTDRERGGRSLRDNCDTSVWVKKEADRSIIICKKQKLGREFEDVPVVFDLVRLPEFDTADEQVTALVGRYDDSQDGQLERLLTQAFKTQESYTQSELVKKIRHNWVGDAPGIHKVREMIDERIGSVVKRSGNERAYSYRLIS